MRLSQEALAFIEYSDGLKSDGRLSDNYFYRGGEHHVIPRLLVRTGSRVLTCNLCRKKYEATQDERGRWVKGDEVTLPSLIDQMASENGAKAQ